VINNAGISTHSLIEWCPVDSLSKLIDVNTIGVVRVTKTFLPLLRESQGRIVIVASAAGNLNIAQPESVAKFSLTGRIAIPFLAAYAMSKAAAISLADGLRRELRTWAVTVHTIEPAFYKYSTI
jgi:short-subunit dehydrogenase